MILFIYRVDNHASEAEEMLALMHDSAVDGNVVLVHKPPDDEEDDQA